MKFEFESSVKMLNFPSLVCMIKDFSDCDVSCDVIPFTLQLFTHLKSFFDSRIAVFFQMFCIEMFNHAGQVVSTSVNVLVLQYSQTCSVMLSMYLKFFCN
jgi:hypothetical protein